MKSSVLQSTSGHPKKIGCLHVTPTDLQEKNRAFLVWNENRFSFLLVCFFLFCELFLFGFMHPEGAQKGSRGEPVKRMNRAEPWTSFDAAMDLHLEKGSAMNWP